MTAQTLTKLIADANGQAINARDTKCTLAHQCWDMYWKVALLVHPREKCANVWVCGFKKGNGREWVAGVSVTILKFLNTCIKLHGSDDRDCGLVIIEPMGTIAHKLKVSEVAKHLERIDIVVSFHDPNQQTLFDQTPKGTPCLK